MARMLRYTNLSVKYQQKTDHYFRELPKNNAARTRKLNQVKYLIEQVAEAEHSLKQLVIKLRTTCPHPQDQIQILETTTQDQDDSRIHHRAHCNLCNALVYEMYVDPGDMR